MRWLILLACVSVLAASINAPAPARAGDAATDALPINFTNHIVPLFTKYGCNGGGCHGKSGGQNGFALSLLGFEPAEDYDHLVREARGRRLFPASPARSLLLLKATGELPHGGGKRLDTDSEDYKLLVRWIEQGMPFGRPTDPTLTRISVSPDQRTLPREADQQLTVTAHYSDGTAADVTRSALYEPNDKELAKADDKGRITVSHQPGDVAIMVRYAGKVAVSRLTVPLGAPVEKLPEARTFIDRIVFDKLKSVGMPPSEVCDDATFLRRVTIDIAGRLPTADEARAFLADADPARRDKWIDQLLASADYADYFASKWSALFRNKRSQPRDARLTVSFHGWLRDALLDNKSFDQLAREIIAASGDVTENPAASWYKQAKDATAQVEDTAQLFLGMRLKCAQCHHHPYEKWSQDDYFSYAAFFSRVGKKPGPLPGTEAVFHRRGPASAVNPRTKAGVTPRPLSGPQPPIAADEDPRLALADWMTSRDNPFFARALVNRYWKHFFGRGLVDPEDDMRDTNPPSNPQLLDALATHFIDSGYDLKELVRVICRSSTYQLSATPNEHNKVDKQYFSRFYPRRLTAEVLLDAVNQVTGSTEAFAGLPPGTRAVQLPDNSFNASSYFLTVFGRPDSSSACECERSHDASLAQSLHLLNAKPIHDKLTSPEGRAAKLAADTSRNDGQKLAELYLWALGRTPTEEEVQSATAYLQKKLAARDPKADAAAATRHGCEDLVWALLNTKEFAFNH